MIVRLRYSKTGRARYISHLDMLRTFQRAFARAGIALVHSEGFNPHPKLNLVLPLPTCCESLCEYLDAETVETMDGGTLCGALNHALPEGIVMRSAASPVMKAGEVRFASWSCLIKLENGSPQTVAQEIADELSVPELTIIKKTKRGESCIDLIKHMSAMHMSTESGGMRLDVTLPCFEPSLTPRNILAALSSLPSYNEYCVRTELFDGKMAPFC